ncbi:MAG: hypothetical protein HY066_14015 [Betaproteobacteria bacterium]|nr:hypothetical protein [Betaproteobacteria bacterium]
MKIIEGACLLAKQTKNGVGIFYDEDKSRVLHMYAESQEGVLPFSFKVHVKDRTFANYTAPAMLNNSAIPCFDSQTGTDGTVAGKIRLSKDEVVTGKDFADIEALVARGVLSENDWRTPPDFVVNILAEIGKGDDVAAREYGIEFNARQSFWKYHLLGNMNRSNPFIVDLDNRVEFEFCGDVMLPDSRPAKVFRSKELIPVLEKSSYRFQLREQGPGAGRVLIKRLPVASESRLGMEVINGKSEVVLESYINF